MIRLVMALVVGLLVSGCATSAQQLVRELGKDNASACAVVTNPVYGSAAACRTNTPGVAVIEASGGSVKIQHNGGGAR